MSGSHLLSHAVARIVPSAVKVLTVVFGMGTGVSPSRIATGQIYQFFSQSRTAPSRKLRFLDEGLRPMLQGLSRRIHVNMSSPLSPSRAVLC